jgi:Asp-tRNA(Asn)/Glu-tRNA(Gln) amidotransferase C subunit
MALSLEPIFEDMVKQFRTTTSDDRFQEDFRTAANRTLDALSFEAELSTALTHVVGYNSSVTGLDTDDQDIFTDVIKFKLVIMGRKHVRGDKAYQELKIESEEALGDFMVKKSRDDQAEVADNLSGEGKGIIGLGDVTDAVSTGTSVTTTGGTDTLNGE